VAEEVDIQLEGVGAPIPDREIAPVVASAPIREPPAVRRELETGPVEVPAQREDLAGLLDPESFAKAVVAQRDPCHRGHDPLGAHHLGDPGVEGERPLHGLDRSVCFASILGSRGG
jgi:hypothetical protein